MFAFIIILVCETTQYVFHLGIFDIFDIVVNMVGFGAGYLMADVLAENSPSGAYLLFIRFHARAG